LSEALEVQQRATSPKYYYKRSVCKPCRLQSHSPPGEV